MLKSYFLSIDQGTTSSRAVLFDQDLNQVGIEQEETTNLFPKPSWVEQDASEIKESQFYVIRKLISRLGLKYSDIRGIGITNQRETTVVWDKDTGKPIYNAIIWQDKRTADFCDQIKKSEIADYINDATGLIIDSYFSATKLVWILDNVDGAKQKAREGKLLFGTVDTWLIWNLTKGDLHITDYSNASRTMLFNIKELCWDKKILDYFDIPEQMLPQVKDSSMIYGHTYKNIFDGVGIPIAAIAGDQQAALFGQHCFNPGNVKNTYGTGCFMLMNTGEKFVKSESGLITTIAWGINGKVNYALEGSVFIAGAAIQWLRDNLKIIETAAQSEAIASEIEDTNGVYFVPAFAGLGAPHWNMEARGNISGITRSTNYKHIVRAALEAMAYQTKDVLIAMEKDSNLNITTLNVDGGACVNNFLLQFQSDILGLEVIRSKIIESTSLGVAILCSLAINQNTIEDIREKQKIDSVIRPSIDEIKRKTLYKDWLDAVKRTMCV